MTDPFRRILMVILLSTLSTFSLRSQDAHREFYSQSLAINNTGMYVLGSWALLNIASGAYGLQNSKGTAHYFHQMNLYWNIVNLSIAGFALYGNYTSGYHSWGPETILEKQMNTRNLFLINGGLDIIYMGTGFLLRNLSGRYQKNPERLKGYGNSVILQGAFLFVFDLVLFGLQSGHRKHFMENVALLPATGFTGLTFQVTL